MTEAEELEFLTLKKRKAASVAPQSPEPWYEDFGEGLGVSGLNTYYGAKSLVTDLDEEDNARLADWKQDAAQSGWGKGGEVVGDIAQIIGTGGFGGAAVKGGLKLAARQAAKKGGPRALRKALLGASKTVTPLTADIVASGGVAGLQLPEDGESRLDNAKSGAVDALTGGLMGKALVKSVKGVTKTREAQKLLDQGVPLTPAQASQGTGIQGIENAMQVIPVLSKGREVARGAAIKEWGQQAMQKAAPKGVKLRGNARARAGQLKDGYNKAYTDVWSAAQRPSVPQIMDMQNTLAQTGKFIGKDGEGALRKISFDLKKLSGDFSPSAVKTLDHTIKKQITKAGRAGDIDLQDGLEAVRRKLRDTLPPRAGDTLKELDGQYGKYLVVKKAGATAKSTSGEFTPQQFMQSVGTVGKETRTFVGDAPLQAYADKALKTVGRTEPAILQDIQKGIVARAPTHQPTMDLGGRMVLGETIGQKAATRAVESPVAKALRAGGVRGSLLNVAHEKSQEN
jgi:hypothetical protein